MVTTFHAEEYSWTEIITVLPKTSESVIYKYMGKTMEAKVLKIVHNYVTRSFEVYLHEINDLN